MTTQAIVNRATIGYVKTVGIVNNGYNGRGFANPYDIAFRPDGRIYVLNRCDPGRASAIRIGVCNLDDEYLFEFGNGHGSGPGQFVWPVAMAFGGDDRLYITDEQNHRVAVYDADGEYVTQWGQRGRDPGCMDGPTGIAIDQEGNLFIADQGNGRVQKFTPDGDLILSWGEPGSEDGEFNLPWGVGVGPDGSVYVADWRNDRVQRFTPEGQHIQTLGSSGADEGQLSRPSGVAVDSTGLVYVSDWGNERVQVFDQDGETAGILRGEATESQWAIEYFSANPEEWEVREMSDLVPDLPEQFSTPYHISSQTEPYFWGPVSVKLDHRDRLYVVETNRHRFQVYGEGF